MPADERPKDMPGPAMSRLLVIVLAILAVAIYVRSPIDLMPDGAGLIGVIDDLLVALGAMWWLRNRTTPPRPRTTARQRARGPGARGSGGPGAGDAHAPGAGAAADETPWDPFAVLGVRPGATRDEIRDAYRTLWCVAAAVLGTRTDADDVVQDAAAVALVRLGDFDPGTDFVAWMAQIVRYSALNRARLRQRHRKNGDGRERCEDQRTACEGCDFQGSRSHGHPSLRIIPLPLTTGLIYWIQTLNTN